MKFRKRYIVIILFALAVCIVPGKVVSKTKVHQNLAAPGKVSSFDNQNEEADRSETDPNEMDPNETDSNETDSGETAQGETAEADPSGSASSDTAAAEYQAQQPITVVKDYYPYNIDSDRESFDLSHVDISVGNRYYMTQINDWFVNFDDYRDKTVEIDGMYLRLNEKYHFVGRNGPVCPYCTGGYVDFEFQSDQDLSEFISGQSWICVTGILREGSSELSNGASQPFYYIEAIRVEGIPEEGVNPVSD